MMAFIPPWVFAVLALLLWLGFVQSRPRLVAPAVIRGVAIGLAAFSLWGVVGSFGPQGLVILAWVAGVAGAAMLGRSVLAPRGLAFDALARRVLVPGSWVPLGLMLGIFALKFGLGFAAGIGSPVPPGSPAAAVVALALGLLSGTFIARARAVVAVAQSQQTVR